MADERIDVAAAEKLDDPMGVFTVKRLLRGNGDTHRAAQWNCGTKPFGLIEVVVLDDAGSRADAPPAPVTEPERGSGRAAYSDRRRCRPSHGVPTMPPVPGGR
jgi:hypothetical protein